MNEELPHKSLRLTPRDEITARQLQSALGALGAIMPFVAKELVRVSDGANVATDGGVRDAAEVTAIAVLDRIERIMKDDSRWGMEPQDHLETALLGMVNENTAFFTAQKEASQMVQKPSFQHRPTLVKLATGWAAVLGDLSVPEESIVGIGSCPAEALNDFDAVFTTAQENKELNEPANMDPAADGSIEPHSPPTKKPLRNRKRTGPATSGGQQ